MPGVASFKANIKLMMSKIIQSLGILEGMHVIYGWNSMKSLLKSKTEGESEIFKPILRISLELMKRRAAIFIKFLFWDCFFFH
jgi:hypothetical protein